MNIIAILSAALPIIGKLLDILTKTPEEKLLDISKALVAYLDDLSAGVKHAKENPGDTSKIDDAINRRR